MTMATSSLAAIRRMTNKILEQSMSGGEIDLDEIMVSAADSKRRQGTNTAHLSKMWKIDLDSAQRTLDVTSPQSGVRKLSSYGTSDRMLRYKQMHGQLLCDKGQRRLES